MLAEDLAMLDRAARIANAKKAAAARWGAPRPASTRTVTHIVELPADLWRYVDERSAGRQIERSEWLARLVELHAAGRIAVKPATPPTSPGR